MNTNEKKLYRTIIVFFMAVSIPIIVLSFLNVPSADDYSFGRAMHVYISKNGFHFFGMFQCAVQNMIDYYMNWEGRYSESIIASFMPDVFGCYWISAIIIYAMLTGGIVFCFYILAERLAGKEKAWMGSCIALVIDIAIVQNVPYPVEAFYWFIGAMAYMFYHSVYLWMCGVLVVYMTSESKKQSMVSLVTLGLLAVFVAGGNNVTAFVSILTYGLATVIAFLKKDKRGIVLPLLLSVGGFLVSYLSPGTTIRGGGSENYTPILTTVIKCFRWTIRQYLLEWTTAEVLLMLCLLTPLILRILLVFAEKYDFKFRYPGIIAIGGVCFLSAMSSPPFYILGEPGPGRLKNIIYVSYIILTVLVYGYFLGWLVVKEKNKTAAQHIAYIYQNISAKNGIIAALIVIGLLCAGDAKQYGVSIEACKEIIGGQAVQYHQEAMERKRVYQYSVEAHIEVSPYSVKPYLLFFDDITDDPENWKNTAVSNFYDREIVKLDRFDPDVEYD